MSEILNPFELYFGQDGRPIGAGSLYIGVAGLDPQLNPIDVFYDREMTVPAQQPLNISGGYVWNCCAPTKVFAEPADYSLKVLGKNGEQVFYCQTVEYLDEARRISYLAPFSGAQTRTQADKNAESVSIKDFGAIGDGTLHTVAEWIPSRYANLAAVQAAYPHVTSTSDSIDWAATQSAVLSAKNVYINDGRFVFGAKKLKIPATISSLFGAGTKSQISSTASVAMGWDGQVRVLNSYIGDFQLSGSNVAESVGFDASGFSYGIFKNLQIRYFKDGLFADGTAFGIAYSQQFSNNLFLNVRSNNNTGSGFKFVGASEANSANTFIGCEGAGNQYGFNEVTAYGSRVVGCAFQGNSVLDFYSNGSHGDYDFYAEGTRKSVMADTLSQNLHITCRSSYPLWNTFVNNGKSNTVSVRGESAIEKHLFSNPHWLRVLSTGIVDGVLPYGATSLTTVTDTTAVNSRVLQINFDGVSAFQGVYFKPKINPEMQGRWVTLILDIDTSNVVGVPTMDIRTRHESSDGTANGTNGQLVSQLLPITTGYRTFTFDVKFSDLTLTAPDVRLLFSNVNGSAIPTGFVKVRSAYCLTGQTAQCSFFAGAIAAPATATSGTTALSSASNVINTYDKLAGKLVYNTAASKMYFALGALASSAWRATDGSGDITPV